MLLRTCLSSLSWVGQLPGGVEPMGMCQMRANVTPETAVNVSSDLSRWFFKQASTFLSLLCLSEVGRHQQPSPHHQPCFLQSFETAKFPPIPEHSRKFCCTHHWLPHILTVLLLCMQEKRSVLVILWILAFLAGNTLYVLYTFSSQQLYSR